MRLPPAYRSETAVVSHCLSSLQGAVDWAAAAKQAAPWVQAVRDNPPPFWAMESLLKEYPISSAEGLALMRLAEALEMGYSLSKLSIAQNGGGLSRTACTQGAACWAALAQSSAPCRAPSRRVTVCASGR